LKKQVSFSGSMDKGDHRKLTIFCYDNDLKVPQGIVALVKLPSLFEFVEGPAKETFEELLAMAVNQVKRPAKRGGWVDGSKERPNLIQPESPEEMQEIAAAVRGAMIEDRRND
jgi:hypothetical protein